MNSNNPVNEGDREAMDEQAFASLDGRKFVYVRPILASDVMGDLRDEFGEGDIELDADAILYSVHDEDGERLALVGDRDLAFAAARQYEMTPLSVH